jgi:thioredoxin
MDFKKLGNIQLQSGNFDLAIEYFTKGIEQEPNNHLLYSNRSVAYLTIHKEQESLKDAEKCIKLDPTFSKGYVRKANALIELENLELAKETLNQAIKLEANEKLEKFEKDLGKVIELKAAAQQALTNSKFMEAIDLYTDALEYKINLHVIYSNRSLSYLQIQNYNEALSDSLQAIKLKPKWSKGYLRQGNAFMGLSNFEKAVKSFQRGLQLDPENASIKKQLEIAKSKNLVSNYKKVNSDQEYLDIVKSFKGLIVVDFYADWCGPCKQVAPYFKQFSSKYKNVLFLKVNVDELQRTSQQAGIKAMPSFLFLKGNKRLEFIEGANLQELQKKIEQHQ